MIRILVFVLIAASLLTGCGEDDDPAIQEEPAAVPGGADPADVDVIKDWADTLRAGDVGAAAEFFAIPSVAENGPVLDEIESVADARAFNASLPCGAEVIRAETEGEITTATFRLTERPGPGSCGDGTGETAKTAFVIEDGLIVEWRRADLPEHEIPGQIAWRDRNADHGNGPRDHRERSVYAEA